MTREAETEQRVDVGRTMLHVSSFRPDDGVRLRTLVGRCEERVKAAAGVYPLALGASSTT